MKTEITLRYSENLVRSAVRAFWWRSTGWSFFGAMALLASLEAYDLSTGNRSWTVGVIGCVLIVAALLAVALYVVHYRRSLSRLRRISIPQALFEPAEETFKITSDVGTLEISWRAVREVWRFPHFWLLFISRSQCITLPLEDLDPEELQFVLDHIKAHGGKVAKQRGAIR